MRKGQKLDAGVVFGLVVVAILVMVASLAPWIAPYDPADANVEARGQLPSKAHWLGTDMLGRDILSRMIYGARVSLLVGIVSVVIGLSIGCLLGLVAGYCGGKVDAAIGSVLDIVLGFPQLLLAIALVGALGPGLVNAMVGIGVHSIPVYARLIRGSVLTLKESEFVQAARVAGAPHMRLVLRHILPNSLSPLIVQSTLALGRAILTESSLSFLGLGVEPPTPSWGGMVSEGREYLRSLPHLATFPGSAIMLTVFALNLVGDGLRDMLDPRLRHRR